MHVARRGQGKKEKERKKNAGKTDQYTTTTFPQNFHIPVSINNGESTTQSWVPVSHNLANLSTIKRRMRGWRRLLSH
jgi:hypothetical protein